MGWGPGAGPWPYTLLTDADLSVELAHSSGARSIGGWDAVSFQPYADADWSNQDRYVAQDWTIGEGVWRFCGLFDGHAGDDTVEHTVNTLPSVIERALRKALASPSSSAAESTVSLISNLLVKEIKAFDEQLGKDLFDIFPEDIDPLTDLSGEEIRAILNDSGERTLKGERCKQGSTVLISILDPSGRNLWVASLGDCDGVLGTQDQSGEWDIRVLSSNHNAKNPEEAGRIRGEHPGEAECVVDDRVLGMMAVTRAVGDLQFKFPKSWTERLLMNVGPPFQFAVADVDRFIARNLSPPYLSNVAEVQHVYLGDVDERPRKRFLIMSSDGLYDLRSDEEEDMMVGELATDWMEAVAGVPEGANKALGLLRHALGGEDEEKISSHLTVEMMERWMDDTTILVRSI
ncbi:protein serine/threonine phosphatase 2C [Punctularia strigosozonata HHB-11173 SS5]|uniref:Protein serine/threonine phosphatase 2C n=1 Tax=Punctularia strigosozonata (strain HHB-11173) TaxID=741275 RepID=R7S1H0_PUNST|nr:protein serine/threonine phosphatase 2C [Punctularia strigosozonata HHB-11173 SS5]EIN03627.1 protein serine/threonine phosphatase 2C [Punctularia strigosozonata HHB-11173 SS5]